MPILTDFRTNNRGAVATEFALLFMILFVLTLGTIEFGLAVFEWARTEKALQRGARFAVVTDPVADGLRTLSGKTSANMFGDGCRDSATGNIQPYCQYDPDPIICTSTGCSGYGFDATAFNAIVARIREINPRIRATDVVIEYRSTELGFVGRPNGRAGEFNLVPAVTVRVQNLVYPFYALDDLLGMPNVPMPEFATTLIGEDLGSVTE